MESDQATQENSDQVMTSDDQQGASQAAKSYECTFCKRGFSNAQALGGHMNIHRKDKAKLKQVSSSNTIETKQHQPHRVLDIPKMPSSYSPMPPTVNSSEHSKPSNHDLERTTIRTSPWPWFLKEGDITVRHIDPNHVGQVQQLPLFAQTPSENKDHQNPGIQQVHGEKGLPPSSSELDLELRLGPEPQDSSSTANTTRKFF